MRVQLKKGKSPRLKQALSVSEFKYLNEIFKSKHWPMPSYPYNKYIDSLQQLTSEQRNLVLRLTERFVWIEEKEYKEAIVTLTNRIFSDYPDIKYFFAIKCIPRREEAQSKSAHLMLYKYKQPDVFTKLGGRISVVDSMEKLADYAPTLNDSLYVMVDDFIGTGDTAVGCIQDMEAVLPGISQHLVALAIAAQRKGIGVLQRGHGVRVYYAHVVDQGIHNNFSGHDMTEAYRIMTEIGKKMKFPSAYTLGYKGSEALITLLRCPNNTLPIYWCGKNAPYPRKGV